MPESQASGVAVDVSDFVGVVTQPTATVSVYPAVVIPFPPSYLKHFLFTETLEFQVPAT